MKYITELKVAYNDEDIEKLLKELYNNKDYKLVFKLGTHYPKFLDNKELLNSAPFVGYKVTIYKNEK